MKAVTLLLATAVALAYGTPNHQLKSIIFHVRCLHQKTQNTEKYDLVFVKDLKKNKSDNCETEFFCQAEKVLSGVKHLNDTCEVDKLLRNLKQYNHGGNCSVPEKGDETILRCFLDDLLKCANKLFSRQGVYSPKL